jgi:hypothetical protein
MFIDDPRSVRYEERVKAGKADINGVSLKDKKQITAWAKEIVVFRAQVTTDAIKLSSVCSRAGAVNSNAMEASGLSWDFQDSTSRNTWFRL